MTLEKENVIFNVVQEFPSCVISLVWPRSTSKFDSVISKIPTNSSHPLVSSI